MAGENILIIEDEESIRMGIEDDLSFEGYTVYSAESGEDGLKILQGKTIDLIILDIMLPVMDGFEFCSLIRKNGDNTPLIMLTAKYNEVDKIVGLEIGADDYVTKPFSPRELLARIKSLLRRVLNDRQDKKELLYYSFGNVDIDFEKYEVTKKGRTVHLTAYEFSILKLMILNAGKVISRDLILDAIWGRDVYVTSRSVDTHIAHLRKKLEDDHNNPVFICSVHGVGYKFVKGE